MYSNSLICDVLDYINHNINKDITIDELSNIFYFDKTYIMKRFKKEIGVSIHDYINRVRILNSLSLYRYDNYILSIALSNGFNSIEYYSEMFRKKIGVNPYKYRKFVNRSFDITDKEIDTIISNVYKCASIKDFSDAYLTRRKPSNNMVKVLKISK